ncbi:MAG: PIG-L family deacetylase [Nanoarchaeota archaeon]|nr:PIG-L family deacetylase [Nanoarchaeota archaeon]
MKEQKQESVKETIMVLCAHNDDQIIGVGGTIAKYAKHGKRIVTVIFSYGEGSHPHLKKEVIIKTRVKESRSADKILCGDNGSTYYLGLTEGKFRQQIDDKDIGTKIAKLIEEHNPSKIFTHSIDDPHRDHKVVYRFVMDLIKKIKYKGDVYAFNVWNLFINIRMRNKPRLVVDITETFRIKIDALERHKSQFIQAKLPLTWSMYARAILQGLIYKKKYAEVFFKIR